MNQTTKLITQISQPHQKNKISLTCVAAIHPYQPTTMMRNHPPAFQSESMGLFLLKSHNNPVKPIKVLMDGSYVRMYVRSTDYLQDSLIRPKTGASRASHVSADCSPCPAATSSDKSRSPGVESKAQHLATVLFKTVLFFLLLDLSSQLNTGVAGRYKRLSK